MGSNLTADDTDDVAAGLVEHHRYHHHGGATLFIAMSLDTLGVAPEQQVAIEGLRRNLLERMDPARLAEQRLLAVLSEGLTAGRLDDAKVDAATLEVSAAATSVHAASVDALNALHAALQPLQRAALVDKVEAHWRVWQQVNLDDGHPASGDVSSLAMMTEQLSLTSDQVAKLRAGLGARMGRVVPLATADVDRELRAFGDAFRKDTFDARQVAGSSIVDARLAGWGASHMANLAEAAVLVLDSQQRLLLGQLLREHADHAAVATVAP